MSSLDGRRYGTRARTLAGALEAYVPHYGAELAALAWKARGRPENLLADPGTRDLLSAACFGDMLRGLLLLDAEPAQLAFLRALLARRRRVELEVARTVRAFLRRLAPDDAERRELAASWHVRQALERRPFDRLAIAAAVRRVRSSRARAAVADTAS